MKTFSPLQEKILECLSTRISNGNQLAQQLHVSRTAIWKNIQQLKQEGVPIIQVKTGYELVNYIPLSRKRVEQELKKDPLFPEFECVFFKELTSTNLYLHQYAGIQPWVICCAEQQTAGRGRLGRSWHSPFGKHIYLSARFAWPGHLADLPGFSLIVSLAVAEVLHAYSPDIKIKWPNDLVWHAKKICGILVEILAENNGKIQLIVGIGLNVGKQDTAFAPVENKLSLPWGGLQDMHFLPIDRNMLISALLIKLHQYTEQFTQTSLESFMPLWDHYDYLKNKLITMQYQQGLIEGIAKGITSTGQLRIETHDGKIRHISSGEASLKHFALD